MWLIVSEKNGISAKELQRQLGFTRYETVWTWLHKLRRAMVRPGRDMLSGRLEVDETYVGGAAWTWDRQEAHRGDRAGLAGFGCGESTT